MTAKAKETKQEFRFNMSKLVRWEVLNQKARCVAPVVMIKEGVTNGLLYPADELAKFPKAWDGRPTPILHPEKDGEKVSANSPERLEDNPGLLFNTFFEDGKLKSEVWLDPIKADEDDPQVMEKLNNNENIEVSTGLYIEVENTPGEYNGIPYRGIARNYRPDHLAILPEGGAACNWDDGAGLPRTNQQQEENVEAEKDPSLFARFSRWVTKKFKANELNHDEIDRRLRDAVRAKLNLDQNDWVWMKEVFDTYCIYEHDAADGVTRLYKQSYVIDSEERVLLADEAVEVKEVTSYPLVSPTPNTVSNQKGKTMDDAKTKEAVDALIANDKSDYAEEDREELTALSEKTLTNLAGTIVANAVEEPVPAPEKVPEPVPAPEVVPKPEGEDQAPKALSAEDVQNAISAGIKTALEANGKVPILERLIANEACKVSKEGLEAMSQTDLEALEESLSPGDYSGRGGVRANDEDEKIDPMPAMTWEAHRAKEGLPV